MPGFQLHTLVEQLEAGHFDIAMAGIAFKPILAEKMQTTDSYLDIHYGVIVEDYRRAEFETLAKIDQMKKFTLGILRDEYIGQKLKNRFPNANVKEFSSPQEYFDGGFLEVDAFVMSAEAASVWTLLNPEFSVVVPQPAGRAVPLTYVVARQDKDFTGYVNHWIELQKKDETIEQLYAHWILGKTNARTVVL